MRRQVLAPLWAVAVVVAWGLVVGGGMAGFYVENSDAALREAEGGQVVAAVGGVLIGGLAAVVPRLGSRFPRIAIGLLSACAVVIFFTSASPLVLASGALCALPIGVGVLLALVPRPEPAHPR